MRVLAAVFANARRIALDIAGIERGSIEGRREQQGQPVVATDQFAIQRGHRAQRATGRRSPGQDRPGLRDRVDPTFLVCGRAERRSIVEEAPEIPIAIPGLPLERDFQRVGVHRPLVRALGFAAPRRNRREGDKRRMEEPTEPDALALALFADAVHAVVPIARAHERQPMPAHRKTRDPARARNARTAWRGFSEIVGRKKLSVSPAAKTGPSRKGMDSSSTSLSWVASTILGDGIGQPSAVIGYSRAHPLARMRQPPMLNIAFDELSGGGPQKMLAREIGPRGRERHAVL